MRFLKEIWRDYFRLDFKEPRQRRRLLFFVTAGAIELLLLSIGGYRMAAFMDTPEFCGEVCHSVMRPEYVAYQNSPHAKVDCVACHIGEGASWLVKSKISGVRQVAAVALNTYSRPIPSPVEELRPARETCEECHWPNKFAGDLVRVRRHFQQDEANTETVNTLVLRVGGGESDVARGIHWHVSARVWYLPLDEKRQDIGWVGVARETGKLEEFVDPSRAGLVTPERLAAEQRPMDCVDCHNRATHVFYSPETLIDAALAQGKIDRALPFIKREGLRALNPASSHLDEAMVRVESIREFYRTSYPKVSQEKPAAIDAAVRQLRQVAELTTFPEMKVGWQTHPVNIGHLQSAGCFRCHGKLVSVSEESKGKVVSSECSVCHYSLPSAPIAPGATPPATRPPAGGPPSIPAIHPTAGCASCHGAGLGGAPKLPDNHTSFTEQACAGCHQKGQPAGVDESATPTAPSQPAIGGLPKVPAVHATSGCAACHQGGLAGAPKFPDSHSGFGEQACAGCHLKAGLGESAPSPTATPSGQAQPVAGGPPNIPAVHPTASCAACHGQGLAGAPKWPDNHASFTEQVCAGCHTKAKS